MSDCDKKTIVIKFALKIEIDGTNVQVCQEPFHIEERPKQRRCRRSSSKQATPLNPRRVGGKDPAHLYALGLCRPHSPSEESDSSSSSCSSDGGER